MKRMLGAFAAAALTLTAGVALAEEVVGTVQNIDATTKKLTVDDETYQWSENATGVKLEELKEGDQVKIMYHDSGDGDNDIQMISKEQ